MTSSNKAARPNRRVAGESHSQPSLESCDKVYLYHFTRAAMKALFHAELSGAARVSSIG